MSTTTTTDPTIRSGAIIAGIRIEEQYTSNFTFAHDLRDEEVAEAREALRAAIAADERATRAAIASLAPSASSVERLERRLYGLRNLRERIARTLLSREEALVARLQGERVEDQGEMATRAAIAEAEALVAARGPSDLLSGWIAEARERLARIEADAEERARERAAREQREREQRERERALQAQVEAARRAGAEAYLSAHGTESERARWRESLLSERDLRAAMEEVVFGELPLADRPRYARLTHDDARHHEECDGTSEVDWTSEDAPHATAEQYAALLAVRAALPPDATATLRRHYGGCYHDDCPVVERYGVRVVVTRWGREFAREYAV